MPRKRAAKPNPTADPIAAAQRAFERNCAILAEDPDGLEGIHAREGNPRTLAPRVPEMREWVDGQLAATAAASEKWKRNTLTPRKDPIAEARKAEGKYEDSMRRALQEKAFGKGLAQVDEGAMQATIEATPSTAVSDGVNRRRQKIEGKIEKLRPLVIAAAQAIDAMPKDTPEQREAAMVANLRNMRAIKAKMRA